MAEKSHRVCSIDGRTRPKRTVGGSSVRHLLLLLLLVGALPLGVGAPLAQASSYGYGSSSDGGTLPAAEVHVWIRDNLFNPPQVQVPVGGSVVFHVEGRAIHTVTADDGSFDSGPLTRGWLALS
jgi:hypothetical protein